MSDIFSLPANWDVNAAFSIFLFNHISCNYVYTQGGTRRFLAMKPEWGISEFISKKVLMNPSNGYLMNDNCVFGAEVFVLENSAVHNSLSLKNVSAPYKHCFNIPKFSEIKNNLWTSEKFTVEGQQWFVKMYPKSVIDGANQYMSIYLHYAGSERVMASYTIRLRNQITVKHKFGTITSPWFAAGSYWGWYKFADVSLLKDAAQGFIMKDCLKLEIDISVLAVIK